MKAPFRQRLEYQPSRMGFLLFQDFPGLGLTNSKVESAALAAAQKQEQAIQKDFQQIDSLFSKGQTEESRRLLNKTWQTVADRWNAHFKCLGANAYFQVSTARIDAEFKFLQGRILELQPDTGETMFEAARIYASAEASAKAAIDKTPKDPAAYLLRARIRHVRENYQGAVEDFSAALTHAPDTATKERIALQWSFYLQELKSMKEELKRIREISDSMVVPPSPFEGYRTLGRELAVTQALQAVSGTSHQTLDAKVKQDADAAKEAEELSLLFKHVDISVILEIYHEEVNQLCQKVGLKAADLPASVRSRVEIGSDGKVSFKPEPKTPPGSVDIHVKSEIERKVELLEKIQNIAFVRWNRQQEAIADPLQKMFYESQALIREDRVPEARLKMMDLYAAGKVKLAADSEYFDKNPESGAMYEQTRLTLQAFSNKALEQLAVSNELLLAQREATERVPMTTSAKLNKVLIRALADEIESGRAVTLDEAMGNIQAEGRRLKASGKDFKVNAYNLVSPLTNFDGLKPGAPDTIAYLLNEYLGWEKDKSFKLLVEGETRVGLEQRRTPDQARRYSLQVAKELRDNRDYSVAADSLERIFAKDLETAVQKISSDRIQEIEVEVGDKRGEIENSIREYNKKNKITESEEAIKGRVDMAAAAQLELEIRSEAYGYMPDITGKHDPIAEEAWKIFNDMKDPNDEWDNLADHSWDALKTEAIVMAVTLPLTMGTGSAVRAGLGGTKLALRLLNAGRLAKAATQGGILVMGSAVEGSVQTLLSSAIHNRDFEWKEVGFNIVTSLAFHGGSRVWGKFADKLGIGDRAIQSAIQSGKSALGKRLGNFAGMMLVQTELSASLNYLLEKLSGQKGGPGFWSLERHLGEGVRQLAYHGATMGLNKATRNWAANAEMRARLKAESAQEHYRHLMKQGKHGAPEARKLAAEMADKEIPSVLGGEDPKKISADLHYQKAVRLVERMGVDSRSVMGRNLIYVFQHSNDLVGLEKGLAGGCKDLNGFIRERLNIDPASDHGKLLLKHFSQALAYGKDGNVLLKEFPELGRMLEAQDVAAKALLSKLGGDKVQGPVNFAMELVGIALERGWSPEDMGRFGEVLARQPELFKNVMQKIAGNPKLSFIDTPLGSSYAAILLVDAIGLSPDIDSFTTRLKDLEDQANHRLKDIEQVSLLQEDMSLDLKLSLFRWSTMKERSREDWSADLQGILEGRVKFQMTYKSVERLELSESDGAATQQTSAKKFASLNDATLFWASTEHFSTENQKIAMEAMADRVLKAGGYKPGTVEYQATRDNILDQFASVARGETNPENGNWPRVAVDLETHLRKGGTMTYVKKDGSRYQIGPMKAKALSSTAKLEVLAGGKANIAKLFNSAKAGDVSALRTLIQQAKQSSEAAMLITHFAISGSHEAMEGLIQAATTNSTAVLCLISMSLDEKPQAESALKTLNPQALVEDLKSPFWDRKMLAQDNLLSLALSGNEIALKEAKKVDLGNITEHVRKQSEKLEREVLSLLGIERPTKEKGEEEPAELWREFEMPGTLSSVIETRKLVFSTIENHPTEILRDYAELGNLSAIESIKKLALGPTDFEARSLLATLAKKMPEALDALTEVAEKRIGAASKLLELSENGNEAAKKKLLNLKGAQWLEDIAENPNNVYELNEVAQSGNLSASRMVRSLELIKKLEEKLRTLGNPESILAIAYSLGSLREAGNPTAVAALKKMEDRLPMVVAWGRTDIHIQLLDIMRRAGLKNAEDAMRHFNIDVLGRVLGRDNAFQYITLASAGNSKALDFIKTYPVKADQVWIALLESLAEVGNPYAKRELIKLANKEPKKK